MKTKDKTQLRRNPKPNKKPKKPKKQKLKYQKEKQIEINKTKQRLKKTKTKIQKITFGKLRKIWNKTQDKHQQTPITRQRRQRKQIKKDK